MLSNKSMFSVNIEPIAKNSVASIWWKIFESKGIVTVFCCWTDYEVQIHTNNFRNILYFHDSLVNNISANALSNKILDFEGK